MFELLAFKKETWEFVGRRRAAFVVSGLLCAMGIVAIVRLALGSGHLGIDFAGGLSMNLALEERIDIDTIRSAFGAQGINDAQIQEIGVPQTGQRLLIKLRGTGTDTEANVVSVLEGLTQGKPVVVEGVQDVGPAVGRLLQKKAGWAVFWAIILITIYIWIRFEYRFGVAAAIAVVHDVLAVLGIMMFLGKDFTMLIVTALLTLAGYSLTDTVVIFDRIRENVRLRPREPFDQVINTSINEILSRTIVTTLTTSLPLFALLFYGSQVTHDFSLALIIGIVVGTFSSWFVASPILVEWDQYTRRKSAAAAINHLRR